MHKQLKRPNSAGSVYKLSGRRRKPWATSISKGYDKKGKRMRELIGCYETKSEALKALAKYDISPTTRPSFRTATFDAPAICSNDMKVCLHRCGGSFGKPNFLSVG